MNTENKISNKINYYEYSHSEIAKRMGLTRNEVRSIERRALEKIKKLLVNDKKNLNKILFNLIDYNINDNRIKNVLSRYEKCSFADKNNKNQE